MKCSELMKTNVEYCTTRESVLSIAERMQQRNVGFVPVCDSAGCIVGTITDRDLALRVLAEHREAESTQAVDVMTQEVICCSPDDDLEVAEKLMSDHKKSRIICVDQEQRPLGVISLSDLLDCEDGFRATQLLRSVSSRELQA